MKVAESACAMKVAAVVAMQQWRWDASMDAAAERLEVAAAPDRAPFLNRSVSQQGEWQWPERRVPHRRAMPLSSVCLASCIGGVAWTRASSRRRHTLHWIRAPAQRPPLVARPWRHLSPSAPLSEARSRPFRHHARRHHPHRLHTRRLARCAPPPPTARSIPLRSCACMLLDGAGHAAPSGSRASKAG